MNSSAGDRPIRFGVFEINRSARELRKHGVKVRLSGQPFAILEMLLEKPGQVITREELQKRIWPADTFVDFEQGLNGAIKKLRDAVGDSPDAPRYIETLPKIGYRFIAPVGEAPAIQQDSLRYAGPETAADRTTEPAGNEKAAHISRTSQSRLWVAMALILVSAGIVTIVAAPHFRKRSPVLQERDTIVVGNFENFTSEPLFDDALRSGLVIGLQQSPFLQVLSDRRSAEILRQMGHSPEERMANKTEIELCQRVGSKVLAAGAIRNLGTSYVVDLSASRCDNGETVAQEQVVAGRKEDVIDALGQAAARIRAKLGESLPSIEKYNAPLEQATTSSIEALKAYGAGITRWDAEGDAVAAPYFERAVELDPDFAMAHGALAAIHENAGEHELARKSATRAYELRNRATGIENLLIESWYDMYVLGDVEKAAQIYEIGLRDYPGNTRALNDLGVIYASLGNYAKGVDVLREVLRQDPSSTTTYGNLATCLMALNRVGDAGKVLDDAEKRHLSSEYLQQVRYWHAFLINDDKAMQRILELSEQHPIERAVLLAEVAQTEGGAGRLQKSREAMESAAALMLRAGDREASATILAQGAVREAELEEDSAAHRLVTRALQLARGQDVAVLAAFARARIGDIAGAEKLSAELDAAYPKNTQVQKYWLPLIRAQIQLGRGNNEGALQALESARPYEMADPSALTVSTLYPVYLRAEALLRKGDGENAGTEFQKILDHPGMTLNYPVGPLAKLGLARSLAQQKEFAKSRAAYEAFFKPWQNADPGLTILRKARAEFEKLPRQ